MDGIFGYFFIGIFLLGPPILVCIAFLNYLVRQKKMYNDGIWYVLDTWIVVLIPLFFLVMFDINKPNDCCNDTAIFAPRQSAGVYILMVSCAFAYLISSWRNNVFTPIAELLINVLLLAGIVFNILFCMHTHKETGPLWVIGNVPIILLFLMSLIENQKRLTHHLLTEGFQPNGLITKWSLALLRLSPFLKFPALTLLIFPLLLLLSLFLLVFAQKPDALIRAFTDTYKHGFSQLDHLCDNVQCGGHYLCSVAANGHSKIVKPERYGERNGNKIICNRQLLVANAFEELLQQNLPRLHKTIRGQYNKVGNMIHQHYHIFNHKWVADMVYIFMKPLEWLFLLVLYTFDHQPENRIACQYLSSYDRQKINGIDRHLPN